jgi:hypothetical protein
VNEIQRKVTETDCEWNIKKFDAKRKGVRGIRSCKKISRAENKCFEFF